MSVMVHPLSGSRFDAVLRPVKGLIPQCVGYWPPDLQVRWFHRYLPVVRTQLEQYPEWKREEPRLDAYYISSTQHVGLCCMDCLVGDPHDGVRLDRACCCRTKPS